MDGITFNGGVLTLDELTPEMISQNLRSVKAPKGFYASIILDHVQSGTPYCIVKPYNEDAEQNSLVTSLNNNIKTLTTKANKLGRQFPQCSVAKIDGNTVLVNMAAHFAAIEAAKNDNDES